MKNILLYYPQCSTCKKAIKWLRENHVDFILRDIVKDNPSKEEIADWKERSGLETKKFFNVTGKIYRERNLKDQLLHLSEDEKLNLLSENGMLLKRPLLITTDSVLLGFSEEQWSKALKK